MRGLGCVTHPWRVLYSRNLAHAFSCNSVQGDPLCWLLSFVDTKLKVNTELIIQYFATLERLCFANFLQSIPPHLWQTAIPNNCKQVDESTLYGMEPLFSGHLKLKSSKQYGMEPLFSGHLKLKSSKQYDGSSSTLTIGYCDCF